MWGVVVKLRVVRSAMTRRIDVSGAKSVSSSADAAPLKDGNALRLAASFVGAAEVSTRPFTAALVRSEIAASTSCFVSRRPFWTIAGRSETATFCASITFRASGVKSGCGWDGDGCVVVDAVFAPGV